MPVLFVMNFHGCDAAYLNNHETSAFPEEQEYLLGSAGCVVKGIESVIKTYEGEKMEIMVIKL